MTSSNKFEGVPPLRPTVHCPLSSEAHVAEPLIDGHADGLGRNSLTISNRQASPHKTASRACRFGRGDRINLVNTRLLRTFDAVRILATVPHLISALPRALNRWSCRRDCVPGFELRRWQGKSGLKEEKKIFGLGAKSREF